MFLSQALAGVAAGKAHGHAVLALGGGQSNVLLLLLRVALEVVPRVIV